MGRSSFFPTVVTEAAAQTASGLANLAGRVLNAVMPASTSNDDFQNIDNSRNITDSDKKSAADGLLCGAIIAGIGILALCARHLHRRQHEQRLLQDGADQDYNQFQPRM